MSKPRKEQYRVTITRPESMKVSDIKKLIIDGFVLAGFDAKVELIRGGVEELPPPPVSLWDSFVNQFRSK